MESPKTPINTDNETLFKGLRHPAEFARFISWLALPDTLREPKSQKELAGRFGVGEDVLSDWKKRSGFCDEVKTQLKAFGRERTADVLNGLYNKARQGNAAEVKLWLQYFESFSEKSQVDTNIQRFVIIDGDDENENPATMPEGTKRYVVKRGIENLSASESQHL